MGGVLRKVGTAARQSIVAGQTISVHGHRYRLKKKLGEGGFGAVYSATAPDGIEVAIKVIDVDRPGGLGQALVQSYLSEIQHLQRLRRQNPHVVHIYDFDFDSRTGKAYMVMELADGNLSAYIDRLHSMNPMAREPGQYISPKYRKDLWRQIVRVISALHQNNTIHMDLKPDNFLMFGRTLKIADLGISRKAETPGMAGVGTMFYSAPEVMNDVQGVQRNYSRKADVWSLGAILYFMTYGEPPRYETGSAPPPRQQPTRDPLLADILRRTLVLSPHARLDTNDLLRHPYTTR